MIILPAIIVLPLIMSILGLFGRLARWLPRFAAGLMIAQVPIVIWACTPALRGTIPPADSGFGVDGVGAIFAILTTIVSAAAMLHAAFLLPSERGEGHDMPDNLFCRFYTWSGLFMLAVSSLASYCTSCRSGAGFCHNERSDDQDRHLCHDSSSCCRAY